MSEQSELDKYYKNCHAMQSGVEMMMHYDDKSTSPKQLRVGVNASMVEHAALVELLVDLGLVTREVFYKKLADKMEEEVIRYQDQLTKLSDGTTCIILV